MEQRYDSGDNAAAAHSIYFGLGSSTSRKQQQQPAVATAAAAAIKVLAFDYGLIRIPSFGRAAASEFAYERSKIIGRFC